MTFVVVAGLGWDGYFDWFMRILRLVRNITNVVAAGLFASSFFVVSAHAQGRAKMDEEPPRPFARLSASAQALRDSVVAMAKRQIGVKYRTGASSPEKGFDCSGLLKYLMARVDISLPRTSHEQAAAGMALRRDISILRPGDLLTFGKGKRVSHVGIYIGDGKYVHASTPGGRVKESSLLTERMSGWWKGARRMIALSDSSTGTAADSSAN